MCSPALASKDLTLHCNVKITRRKGLNFVCDASGTTLFSSHEVFACLNWLLENDRYHITICDGERRIRIMLGRVAG